MPVGGRSPERSMTITDARAALDALVEHGFITGWRNEPMARIWIDFPGAYRSYTYGEVKGFVDGCRAMGAGC